MMKALVLRLKTASTVESEMMILCPGNRTYGDTDGDSVKA